MGTAATNRQELKFRWLARNFEHVTSLEGLQKNVSTFGFVIFLVTPLGLLQALNFVPISILIPTRLVTISNDASEVVMKYSVLLRVIPNCNETFHIFNKNGFNYPSFFSGSGYCIVVILVKIKKIVQELLSNGNKLCRVGNQVDMNPQNLRGVTSKNDVFRSSHAPKQKKT